MILLDELDIKDKEKDPKSESLPPYSPRRSFRLPLGPTTPRHASSNLYPRPPPSIASSNYAQSRSSFTINSSTSSQTLQPPSLPSPPLSAPLNGHGPSTPRPQSSLSASSSSPPLSTPRTRPPRHLRASNNVFVQRGCAAITGTFLIDPALRVPECLLPDGPDVLIVRDEGLVNGKGKQKRANLCLVTHSGDISVDIWVREGCARRQQRKEGLVQRRDGAEGSTNARSTGGNASTNGGSSRSGSGSAHDCFDTSGSTDYWKVDWTSPPNAMPWPEKTKERVDIDIRSDTGSIMVRIHAQSHQRLRIHASSAQGSVAVGIPRTFAGYVQSNLHARTMRSDSASVYSFNSDSTALTLPNKSAVSLPRMRSSSLSYIPGFSSGDKEKAAAMADEIVESIVQEVAQVLPIPQTRQPVQFSSEMEGVVTALSEQRKTGRGRYLVGDDPGKFSERIAEGFIGQRFFDELHLENDTGAVAVFYNDEFVSQKTDGIIMKLLSKAW